MKKTWKGFTLSLLLILVAHLLNEVRKNPIPLWSWVWQKCLSPKDKVVAVKGWRHALIDNCGSRRSTIIVPQWVFWDYTWTIQKPENKIFRFLARTYHGR